MTGLGAVMAVQAEEAQRGLRRRVSQLCKAATNASFLAGRDGRKRINEGFCVGKGALRQVQGDSSPRAGAGDL